MLRPPGDLGAHALRGERIAQRRLDLFDVALAARALVVEQARDALVGVGFELAEREVLQFPLQLPDAEPVGERRVDVARQPRQRAALSAGSDAAARICASWRASRIGTTRRSRTMASSSRRRPSWPPRSPLFGVQRPHLSRGALSFQQRGDARVRVETGFDRRPPARYRVQDRCGQHFAVGIELRQRGERVGQHCRWIGYAGIGGGRRIRARRGLAQQHAKVRRQCAQGRPMQQLVDVQRARASRDASRRERDGLH